MKLVSLGRRRFISKWSCGSIATGKKMQLWEFRPHSNCPFCLQELEDVPHILHCTHEEARKCSEEALWALIESLVKIGTCTSAVRAIRDDIRAWRDESTLPDLNFTEDSLRQVIEAQREIGWQLF